VFIHPSIIFGCSPVYAPYHTLKYLARLRRLGRDKHSSLLCLTVSGCDIKGFVTFDHQINQFERILKFREETVIFIFVQQILTGKEGISKTPTSITFVQAGLSKLCFAYTLIFFAKSRTR